MTWLLVLVLTTGAGSQSVPWALVAAASVCRVTGGAVARMMETEAPGLRVQFLCIQQVSA